MLAGDRVIDLLQQEMSTKAGRLLSFACLAASIALVVALTVSA